MLHRLKDQVALVTGAGQGIGRGIALGLAREGCSVVLSGRRQSTLEAVAGEIAALGAQAFVQTADVSSESDVEALFAAVQQRFGQIDILVNNAGAFDGGPL
ncbi:MAG TPA: SDR family NAD(P)-dependent oxidoreductase, partial [Planctomycetaceae bacterium]|nr:SDR family NAD(P)-dependent oxidoreductase [Planctomycetaceae bacterium]